MKESKQHQVVLVDLVGFLPFLRVLERIGEQDLRDAAVLGIKTSPCLSVELSSKRLQRYVSLIARVVFSLLNCLLEGREGAPLEGSLVLPNLVLVRKPNSIRNGQIY